MVHEDFIGYSILVFPALTMAKEYREKISTGKASVDLFIMELKGAKDTAIMLPDGPWGLVKTDASTQRPLGRNFLVQSAPLFYERGITTVVMGKPSNAPDLNDGLARTSRQHADDILTLFEYASKTFGHPVWLIGTSRGIQSGVAATLRDDKKLIKGLVLSAIMLSTQRSEVSILNLDLKKNNTARLYFSSQER
jgi:hypothetical protein